MNKKLANPAEFKGLLEALVEELVEAREHFHLHQELSAAIPEYQDVFDLSVGFWSLTLNALIDATLVRLCKAYDLYRTNTLNLKSFLKMVDANLHLFDEPSFRERLKHNPYLESLAKDRESPTVRLKSDFSFVTDAPVVKKLTIWRNNFVAHRSLRSALAPAEFTKAFPLTFAEINQLIDKGLEIVNHYSILFNASSTLPWEVKDHKYVLDAVRRDLKRRNDERQQHIEAVRALTASADQLVDTHEVH